MKTATIRQVRNDFGRILRWIADGEEVTGLNRTRPVARILAPRPPSRTSVKPPDFMTRVHAIFGNRRTHAVEALLSEREEERW
jgi:antitoxin (DNA-binding transcriptional repressor) of toxin-antitoxin stability system